jgi:type III pantothenate kinase
MVPQGSRPATRIIAPTLVALDIGNTDVTVGLFRAGSLVATRRAATDPRASADEFEVLLEGLLRLDDASLADVSAIVAASVVPTVTAAAETVAARHERSLLLATAGTVPIPIRVDRPQDVGADRLVNALAAQRLHGTPAVVVDFGTATTFDCVAADGAYVGGAIAPGLELGLEALASRTAKLPRIELRAPDRAIGRDTVSAMQSGTVFGYQALASGLLARIRTELAEASGIGPAEESGLFWLTVRPPLPQQAGGTVKASMHITEVVGALRTGTNALIDAGSEKVFMGNGAQR